MMKSDLLRAVFFSPLRIYTSCKYTDYIQVGGSATDCACAMNIKSALIV